MQTDIVLFVLKTEIDYSKVKYIIFALLAMLFFGIQLFTGTRSAYTLCYGLMVTSALVLFFQSFATWKAESRMAALARLPVSINTLWNLRSSGAIFNLVLYLGTIMLFQLVYDNSRQLAERIILVLNQSGLAVAGLFIYQLNDDSIYTKSKLNKYSGSDLLKKARILLNVMIMICLIYGAISLSFFGSGANPNKLLKDQSLMLLIAVGIDIIAVVLYNFSRKTFLARKSFIDISI